MKDGLHINDLGDKRWYKNGKIHRDNDLPACEYSDGNKYWYQNGNTHRIGNHAIIYHDNTKRFHINVIEYTEENYWKEIGKRYGLVIRNKVKI